MSAEILDPFKTAECGLLTFGQLLKLKREQLGLKQHEAINKSKISTLSRYEQDASYPQKKVLERIIAFYKLTKKEIDSCRPRKELKQPLFKVPQNNRINTIIGLLKETMTEVDKMNDKGFLAGTMKKTALDNLKQSYDLLNDIDIIDRLI